MNILLFLFLNIDFMLLAILGYVEYNLTSYTLQEIIFFLNTSIEGLSESLYIPFLKICFMIPFIASILIFFLPKIVNKICKRKIFIISKYKIYLCFFCMCSIVEISYLYNKKYDIFSLINTGKSTLYEENYVGLKENDIQIPAKKKNLIVISLESMEKSFADKKVYSRSLIEDLETLEKGHIVFNNYQNGFGTTPTAPSLIGVFTGTPVTISNRLHYFQKNENIFSHKIPLSKIYTLGNFLKDLGYSTVSIQGGDGKFAGTNKFLSHYGIDEIIDSDILKQKYSELQKEDGPWGYGDEKIFWVAQKQIEKLEKNKNPFFLLIQTVDTHNNDLPQIPYEKKFENNYYNIINNTSKLTSNFVKWLEKRRIFKNTTIVIYGDHLRNSDNIPYPSKRSIYNLFINAAVKPKNTDRTFTQIDMFPTILEAMGVKIKGHRLGLGTSVFSEEPTLAERFSPEYLAKELAKRSKIYEDLW